LRSVNSLKRVPEGGGQSQFDSKTRKLGTVPCADSPGTFGTVPCTIATVPCRFKKPALKQDKRQLPAGIPQAIYPVVHAGDVRATKDCGDADSSCGSHPQACRCPCMLVCRSTPAGRDRSYPFFQEHAADPLPRSGTPSCFTSASAGTAARSNHQRVVRARLPALPPAGPIRLGGL
jgi:hypothetical protein